MKADIRFRNEIFILENNGEKVALSPSAAKVGLPRAFLEEAVAYSFGPFFKVVPDDTMTPASIKLLNEFEITFNFLLGKGAEVISTDFQLQQVNRHV